MTDILDQVLREELERLKRIEVIYMEELQSLPRGSIVLKKIKGKEYPYLQYRMGEKVKSKYIKSDELKEVTKAINRRIELEQAIKRVLFDKNKIERILDDGSKL